jgi:hypothetical protein
VIRRVWRTISRFLRSAGLVSVVLALIALWSIVATAIPQGAASSASVSRWATAHAGIEPLVAFLGLHAAFTSVPFLVCGALLALSTALCSWQRTKVAVVRTRTLRKAATADVAAIGGEHDCEIACGPGMDRSAVLQTASQALQHLGVRTRRRDDVLAAVSSPLAVWGSPVFHWALLALMAVVLTGSLVRADGMMAVAVGQARPDAPASYGLLSTGPLYDWSKVSRVIRLDKFEPDYKSGGIDRGPVPTVSVLDAAGKVIKTQRVYPNMMLHVGSLSINAPAYGLSATMSLEDTSGAEVGHSIQSIDFSQEATDGTVPVEPIGIYDAAGKLRLVVAATVVLDRRNGHAVEWLPKDPTARIRVYGSDRSLLLDRTVKPGESFPLPGAESLRLVDIGWYSRLALVDDWTTPLLYAVMVVAMLALAVTVSLRQQVVLASVIEDEDGCRLALRMRLWRNASATRTDIERELTEALAGDTEGSAS